MDHPGEHGDPVVVNHVVPQVGVVPVGPTNHPQTSQTPHAHGQVDGLAWDMLHQTDVFSETKGIGGINTFNT